MPPARPPGALFRSPGRPKRASFRPRAGNVLIKADYSQIEPSYPGIVERIQGLMNEKPSAGCSYLVVDATGVGRPVVDLLRQKGLRPKGVTITGGDRGSQDGADWPVPKRELVSTIQVLLQGGRLKIAEELPNAAVLIQELLHFRVKIDLVTARKGPR